MKKLLITGGTGYIGSHTVVEFLAKGYDVVIADNLSNSRREVVEEITEITGKEPFFYETDCTDLEAMAKLFAMHHFDGVIHFAASKAVNESIQKPLLYYRNNLLSLLVVLECMTRYGVKNLVYSSSCTVYGTPSKLPVEETSSINTTFSPYGRSKQMCEEIIRDTVASGAEIASVSLRYFNPIGAHPSALLGEEPSGVPQNLLPFLTQAVAGIRDELAVFGNNYNTPDGSCIRDYIYVCDLAEAHLLAYERLSSGEVQAPVMEVYNIGTGKGVSVLGMIHAFEEATGEKVPYRIADRRPGDIEAIWANADKALEILGWKAKTSLEETLRTAWQWQKKILSRP